MRCCQRTSPNIGRHVLPRMEPDQPSSDTGNVLSATVPASSGASRAAGLTAMPSEHGTRVTCPVTQVLNQAGVTCLNRFAPLGEDAEGIPVPSRPEEFAMTECSDTESCELAERPCRRLRLTWNASAPDMVPPTDSHDQRLARVRRVMQRERRDRAVQAASDFVASVVERVGPVDLAGEVPRGVRRLRWSVFNVPLLWAAAAGDDDCAVLEWSSARAVSLPSMFVDGVQVPALEVLHIGWRVLCDTMRSWGVSSREDFAEWMHRQ